MTREEMLDYLIPEEDNWLRIEAEKKSDAELLIIYNREVTTRNIIQDIIENGITTFRIFYDADREIQASIVNFMKENEMYCFYNGKIEWNIHIGNYCIVGIPEKFIPTLQEKFGETIKGIDLKRSTLSKKDIAGLKEGDKVRVVMENAFAGMSANQGTIYKITENEVTVRIYRSKTKGFRLRIGEAGSIEKIAKFNVA